MSEWRVAFREWAPDLPAIVNPGLVKATNVLPAAAGYMPLPSLSATGLDALDARPRGAISGLDTGSNAYHIVGTETKLYRASQLGVTDVSRAVGGPYNASGIAQWHFEQHENLVIAVNPGDDIQVIDLASGVFSQLSVDAPRARYIGYIGPILVVANLISDPVFGTVPDAYRSPALGNPASWPDPTDPNSGAVAAQAVLSRIEGNGGRILAIVSGSEVGAFFQENAVARAEYVGGDIILQVDNVKKTKGLLAPRAVVPFERKVLYLSEDGWQIFDYTSGTPIGDQKINRTFLADYDGQYPDRVSAVQHPDLPVAVIAYPGAGNTGGTPNKLLFYNYAIDRWAQGEQALELLTRVSPFSLSIDDLLGDLDTDYPISFDDALSGFGAAVLGAYTTGFVLASFSGTSLAATIETGDQEHEPGRITRVSKVRPLIDSVEPTVQVSARFDRRLAESAITFGSAASLNREGACPVRSAKGRYHRYRVNIPAGWTDHAVGLDVMGAPGGSR
jgi:hypothetical protein